MSWGCHGGVMGCHGVSCAVRRRGGRAGGRSSDPAPTARGGGGGGGGATAHSQVRRRSGQWLAALFRGDRSSDHSMASLDGVTRWRHSMASLDGVPRWRRSMCVWWCHRPLSRTTLRSGFEASASGRVLAYHPVNRSVEVSALRLALARAEHHHQQHHHHPEGCHGVPWGVMAVSWGVMGVSWGVMGRTTIRRERRHPIPSEQQSSVHTLSPLHTLSLLFLHSVTERAAASHQSANRTALHRTAARCCSTAS